MRFLLLLLALCACSGPAPTGTKIAVAERDAPLRSTEGAIGGIVLDAADGHPLSMVSVQAEQGGKRVAQDISDYRGRYRLGPLPPGQYDVSAKFANARVHYKDILVEASNETKVRVGIDLRDHGDKSSVATTGGGRGIIDGFVVDGAQGEAFPGAALSLSADHLDDVVMTIADENGAFQFKGLRSGIYSLSCYYTLIQQGTIEVKRGNIVVEPGETTSVEMRLDLRLK